MVFEPSLVPVLPNNPSVEVVYHTSVSSQWTTQNITAIIDTPYNVIDVSLKLIYLHSDCLVTGPNVLVPTNLLLLRVILPSCKTGLYMAGVFIPKYNM